MFYQPPATERNASHTARTLTCYLAGARTLTYNEEHASFIFRRCRLCTHNCVVYKNGTYHKRKKKRFKSDIKK